MKGRNEPVEKRREAGWRTRFVKTSNESEARWLWQSDVGAVDASAGKTTSDESPLWSKPRAARALTGFEE